MPCGRSHRHHFLGLIAAGLLLLAGVPASSAAAPAGQVWGLALPATVTTVKQAQLNWLAGRGVTSVVAIGVPQQRLARLVVSAKRARLAVIAPTARTPKSACRSTTGTLRRCATLVRTPTAAVTLARRSLVDYVVVYVRTPRQLRMLRGTGATRSRIVAVLPLRTTAAGRSAWRAGIAYATTDPALDLAVTSGPAASGSLGGYLSLLPRTKRTSQADTQAPAVPQGMAFSRKTQKTVSLVWNAATDNVGVTGYRLYRNGNSVATVTKPGHTYSGLTCGKRYTFALAAYDEVGNTSNRAQATGSTSTNACTAGAPRPPPPPPAPAPGPLPPPAGTANLWVDVNGGSCTRQAAPGGYADGRACSWNQAYQSAQTGDFVLVRAGNYGNVTIGPNRPSIAAPGVSFLPAAGETVTVRDLENGINGGADGGNNIRFLGPVTARTFRSDDTSNILVDGWRVDCGGCDGVQIFHLEDAQSTTVRDSNIGDNKNNSLIWISGSSITFENNRIHDAGLPSGSGAHTECMYVWRVTNLTLRRNHFYHCSVMDVFITGGDVASGGLVENNVFEKPWENTGRISNSALAFHFRNGGSPSPDPNDWDFRYNTFLGPLSITPGENPVGAGGMRVTGNLFLSGSPCGLGNTTYSYNAFVSGGCGSNNIVHSAAVYLSGFLATGDPGNFALLAGSVLRDKGNPNVYPSVDRNGNSRPAGAAPDIGAYEFGG